MDKVKQQAVFAKELDKLVWKMTEELNLTYAEVVGILQIKVNQLSNKANEKET